MPKVNEEMVATNLFIFGWISETQVFDLENEVKGTSVHRDGEWPAAPPKGQT